MNHLGKKHAAQAQVEGPGSTETVRTQLERILENLGYANAGLAAIRSSMFAEGECNAEVKSNKPESVSGQVYDILLKVNDVLDQVNSIQARV